jgi:hypothetical protein
MSEIWQVLQADKSAMAWLNPKNDDVDAFDGVLMGTF